MNWCFYEFYLASKPIISAQNENGWGTYTEEGGTITQSSLPARQSPCSGLPGSPSSPSHCFLSLSEIVEGFPPWIMDYVICINLNMDSGELNQQNGSLRLFENILCLYFLYYFTFRCNFYCSHFLSLLLEQETSMEHWGLSTGLDASSVWHNLIRKPDLEVGSVIPAVYLKVKGFAKLTHLIVMEQELGPWWVDFGKHNFTPLVTIFTLSGGLPYHQPYDHAAIHKLIIVCTAKMNFSSEQ